MNSFCVFLDDLFHYLFNFSSILLWLLMHQVIIKRNAGLSVFIFEMGILYAYIRESETKEMCVV